MCQRTVTTTIREIFLLQVCNDNERHLTHIERKQEYISCKIKYRYVIRILRGDVTPGVVGRFFFRPSSYFNVYIF